MIIIIVLATTFLYTHYNSCMDKSITSIHTTYTNQELENIYNEKINSSNQDTYCDRPIQIKTGFQFYKQPSYWHKTKEVTSLTFITSNYTTFAWYEKIQIPFLQESLSNEILDDDFFLYESLSNEINDFSLYIEKEKTVLEIQQDNQLHYYKKTRQRDGEKSHIFLKYLNTLEQENTIIPTIQKTILYTLALLQKKHHNVRFYIDLESINNYNQLDIFTIFTQDYCNDFKNLFLQAPLSLAFLFKCGGKKITVESNFFIFIDTLSAINEIQLNKREQATLDQDENSIKCYERECNNGNIIRQEKDVAIYLLKCEIKSIQNHKNDTSLLDAVTKMEKLKNNQYLLDKDLDLRAFYIYLFCLSIHIKNINKYINSNKTGLESVVGRYVHKYIAQALQDIENRKTNKNYDPNENLNWFHDADKIVRRSERGYNTNYRDMQETQGIAQYEAQRLDNYFKLPNRTFMIIYRELTQYKKPLQWFASCLLFCYVFKRFCPQYYASFLNIITIQEYNKSYLYTDSKIAS